MAFRFSFFKHGAGFCAYHNNYIFTRTKNKQYCFKKSDKEAMLNFFSCKRAVKQCLMHRFLNVEAQKDGFTVYVMLYVGKENTSRK
jgi:hypothetical protein